MQFLENVLISIEYWNFLSHDAERLPSGQLLEELVTLQLGLGSHQPEEVPVHGVPLVLVLGLLKCVELLLLAENLLEVSPDLGLVEVSPLCERRAILVIGHQVRVRGGEPLLHVDCTQLVLLLIRVLAKSQLVTLWTLHDCHDSEIKLYL